MKKYAAKIFFIAAGFIIISAAFFIRTHIAEMYLVAAKNMEPIFVEGQQIWVNKMRKGNGFKLPNGKVVVFSGGERKHISRIVAGPGDTLRIKDGVVEVNNNTDEFYTQMNYSVILKTRNKNGEDKVLFKKAALNPYQLNELHHNFPNSISLRRYSTPIYGYPEFYPTGDDFKWNANYFGPVIIPSKGRLVIITAAGWPLVAKIMERYEGFVLPKNTKFPLKYRFKNDYYFVMNDNRDGYPDSRTFGFIPQISICGVAK